MKKLGENDDVTTLIDSFKCRESVHFRWLFYGNHQSFRQMIHIFAICVAQTDLIVE